MELLEPSFSLEDISTEVLNDIAYPSWIVLTCASFCESERQLESPSAELLVEGIFVVIEVAEAVGTEVTMLATSRKATVHADSVDRIGTPEEAFHKRAPVLWLLIPMDFLKSPVDGFPSRANVGPVFVAASIGCEVHCEG